MRPCLSRLLLQLAMILTGIKLFAAFLLFSSVHSVCTAESSGASSTPSGFHVGLSLGLGVLKTAYTAFSQQQGLIPVVHSEDRHVTRSAFLGELYGGYTYKLPGWFVGGEGGLALSGLSEQKEVDEAGFKINYTLKHTRAFFVHGVCGLQRSWANPFVKLGFSVGNWKQDWKRSMPGYDPESLSLSKNLWGFSGGVGLEKNWEDFGMRLAYTLTCYPSWKTISPSPQASDTTVTQQITSPTRHAVTLGAYIVF